MKDLDKKWTALVDTLEKKFKNELSLKGILYLIGVQELNMGIKNFSKEEKINVLHVAVCKILVPYGYFVFEKIDEEGWPHYKEKKALKNLSDIEQKNLIKKAIIKYLS